MTLWDWPNDSAQTIWLEDYHLRAFPRAGNSTIFAARARAADLPIPPRTEPIVYLIKEGAAALHERLYYILAQAFDVPHQIVFWASPRLFREDGALCAIRFEPAAIQPREIGPRGALYRRQWCPIQNSADVLRQKALHIIAHDRDFAYEYMLRGKILFGIDAAAAFGQLPLHEVTWIKDESYTELRAQVLTLADRADLVERLLDERALVNEIKFGRDYDLIRDIEQCARQLERNQALARRELK